MKTLPTILKMALCLALLLIAAPVRADDEKPNERPPSIAQAEEYFANLHTAKARFLQTAQNGNQLAGTFYLSRPGKLRFEYDAPIRDFVVADGIFIYFYDAELGQQSNAPIGQTLADFLLRPEIKLEGDLKVTQVVRSGGLTQISIVQKADPGAGKLVLGFTENPFALKKWRVVDATGAITEVELFDVEQGVKLPKQLFVYKSPAGTRRYN